MSVGEYRKQFERIIERRGYGDDQYIDVTEESDVLKDCVDTGIPLESAQAVLLDLCKEKGYVLESHVRNRVRTSLALALGDDGKIDEGEFQESVAVAVKASKGKRDEVACIRLVIDMIEKGDAPVKTGFFSDWFKRAKREVGLA